MTAQGTTISTRFVGIDALRVVGVVAVIVGHVWSSDPLRAVIYTWHVPVFFFLTGYLWSSGRDLSLEWSKRWTSIGRPYVAWFIVIMLLLVARQILSGQVNIVSDLQQLYGGAFATRPFSTFWFVSALFATCLLYRVVCRLPLGLQWVIAAVGVAGGAFAGDILARTPLAIGAAIPCLVFLVAGRSFRILRGRICIGALVGGVLVMVAAVLVSTGLSAVPDLKGGNFGTPFLSSVVAILASAGLLLLFEAAFAKAPVYVGTVVTALAVPAIAVVLVHPVFLWALDATPPGRIRYFLIALVGSWAIAFVLQRTRFSRAFIGVPRLARA